MSLLKCFDDNGEFDSEEYTRIKRRRREDRLEELRAIVERCCAVADEETSIQRKNPNIIRRGKRRGSMPMKLGPDNELIPMHPTETVWWRSFIRSPPLFDRQFKKKFRRRFRIGHHMRPLLHFTCLDFIQTSLQGICVK